MSCCNDCAKPGMGDFAGNDACEINNLSKKARELAAVNGGAVGYNSGVPYISNKVNVETMIPVIPILAGAAALGRNTYAQQAEAGTVTKPKTLAGKALGAFTGRTAAWNSQEAAKTQGSFDSGVAKNLTAQGTPISGGVKFGNSGDQTLKILGIGAVTLISFFFFNRGKGRRKRRY